MAKDVENVGDVGICIACIDNLNPLVDGFRKVHKANDADFVLNYLNSAEEKAVRILCS